MGFLDTTARSSLPPLNDYLCESKHRIGKYILGEKIGGGCYSVVRKCSVVRGGMGNKVIKIMLKGNQNQCSIQHIANETRALRQLQSGKIHKNIITFSEMLHGQMGFYLVCERCQCDLVSVTCAMLSTTPC